MMSLHSLVPTVGFLAQQNSDAQAAGFLAGFLGIFCCMLLVVLGIWAFVAYLVYNCFLAIPEEHRKQSPGLVWLMLIPIFNLVWSFFVFPKLSESFASYFAAKGRTDKGDCSRSLAMAFCICAACGIIPYLGMLASLAALVLLILYLVKAHEYKSQVVQMESGPAAPPPAA